MEHLSPARTVAEEHGNLFERSGLGLRGSRTAPLLVRDGACRGRKVSLLSCASTNPFRATSDWC